VANRYQRSENVSRRSPTLLPCWKSRRPRRKPQVGALLQEVDHALSAAASAQTEYESAYTALQERTDEWELAKTDLEEAKNALTQSPVPALRTWIRARASLDRADEASAAEPSVANEVERSEAEQRRATTASASASTQGMLLLAGGAAVAFGGTALLALLGSPIGIVMLLVGAVVAVLGVRALASRGHYQAVAENARTQHVAASSSFWTCAWPLPRPATAPTRCVRRNRCCATWDTPYLSTSKKRGIN
jgi:hypothetical protein